MIQRFLKAYEISLDIYLADDAWKELFGVVVQHFPTARLHSFLSDFIRNVAEAYKKSERAVDFFFDLMQGGVDKLLSG